MEFSLESHEILPYVRVYTGAFPDIWEMLSVLFEHEKTTTEDPEVPHLFEPYRPWYTFGRVTDVQRTPEDCSHEYIQRQLLFRDRVVEVREAVIADYCNFYKVDDTVTSEKWIQSSVNLAEYFADASVGKSHIETEKTPRKAMNYHTDFEVKKMHEEGDNFLLTCNIYWNDNYRGGEIVFFSGDILFPYKPKMGEVVIFPSGSPYFPEGGKAYFHCANSVYDGQKYFSRNYLQYKHFPTEEMSSTKNEFLRGDRKKGDHHYDSLFNQMMIGEDHEGKLKSLVHPVVKKVYGSIQSSTVVDVFGADLIDQ